MVISAKFESRCGRCSGLITLGTKVEWSRGRPAAHIVCPRQTQTSVPAGAIMDPNRAAVIRALAASRGETVQPTQPSVEDRARAAVDAAVRTEELKNSTDLLCAIVNGDAEGDAAVAQAALDIIEVRLSDEYDAIRRSQVRGSGPDNVEAAARLEALKSVPKGIYRVSFNGTEKTYGVDYVNVQLVPNEKKGTVKVGEWQGVGVGFISAGGTLNYWRQSQWSEATDPSNPRVQAVVAALNIILNTADPTEYAKAYARESQTCWRCGADLVDALSCERLMGPDCYRMQYGKGK